MAVRVLRLVAFSAWVLVVLSIRRPYNEFVIEEECDGKVFRRKREPFAVGHNGAVNIFLAKNDDDKLLVWKSDPRAGPSAECDLLKRLASFGMRGLGCLANCPEGLLVPAIMDPRRDIPAPSLLHEAIEWLADGNDLEPLVELVLPQYLEELEKMMLAGILNLDQHTENILVQGDDLEVVIAEFDIFEKSTMDFTTWGAIPASYKIAMFASEGPGLAFCSWYRTPRELCTAAREVAQMLLNDDLDSVRFQMPETKELARQGLQIFVKVGAHSTSTAADMINRQPIDPTITQVDYRKYPDLSPLADFSVEPATSSLEVKPVKGGRAYTFGVREGWQLLGWKQNDELHEVNIDTLLEELSDAHGRGDVRVLFKFPPK